MTPRVLTLLLVAWAAAACGGPQGGAAQVEPIEVPPADREALARGNTAFAMDLYRRLAAEGPGNLFLSPFSISTALSMTSAGAAGGTLEEMRRVLALDLPEERLHEAWQSLLARLAREGGGKGPTLFVANALWGQRGFRFRPAFPPLLRARYGADLVEVDFRADAEGARRRINEWTGRQTRDRIQDLIPEGVLNALTRLVLTNAIYFKGSWKDRFDRARTREDRFRLASGETAPVRLMARKGTYPYAESAGLQLLELPYEGEALSMLVALPEAPDGLRALEEGLAAGTPAAWARSLAGREVRVEFPRFRVTAAFSLGETLQALGMTAAFSGAADFSRLCEDERLFIQAVLHKAFVEVDEEGTEAAAATGVAVGRASVEPAPPLFRADRPFLFLIRHRPSGSILFLGRLERPGG